MNENQKKFEQLVKWMAELVDVDGQPVFAPDQIEELMLATSFRVGLGTFFKKDAHRVVDIYGTARWEWTDKGTRYGAYESVAPAPMYRTNLP